MTETAHLIQYIKKLEELKIGYLESKLRIIESKTYDLNKEKKILNLNKQHIKKRKDLLRQL